MESMGRSRAGERLLEKDMMTLSWRGGGEREDEGSGADGRKNRLAVADFEVLRWQAQPFPFPDPSTSCATCFHLAHPTLRDCSPFNPRCSFPIQFLYSGPVLCHGHFGERVGYGFHQKTLGGWPSHVSISVSKSKN